VGTLGNPNENMKTCRVCGGEKWAVLIHIGTAKMRTVKYLAKDIEMSEDEVVEEIFCSICRIQYVNSVDPLYRGLGEKEVEL
jgi:hypothetical protein